MSSSLKAGAWAVFVMGMHAGGGLAAERLHIANEGAIRDRWMLADGAKLAAPGYPGAFAERGDNVCMAMGYAINPDGSTSDFGLLKAWTSSTGDKEPAEGFWEAFSQASASALSQWKFKPRPEVTDPQPTYTVATMTFMGRQATDAAGLRSRCAISDLASLVQKQKWDAYQRGTPESKEMERLRRWQNSQRSMVETPGRSGP